MKILVKKIIAYQYGELDAYAKENAKRNHLEKVHLPDFFSEDLLAQLDDKFGLNGLNPCYSLEYCQGDGLCLYGQIIHSELFDNGKFRKIAFKGIHHKQIQAVYDELYQIDFKRHSRYCHAETAGIESRAYDPDGKQAGTIAKITDSVRQWYFSFCGEWEQRGYDYFHRVSEDAMNEICKEREYLFTGDGNFIDGSGYKELENGI